MAALTQIVGESTSTIFNTNNGYSLPQIEVGFNSTISDSYSLAQIVGESNSTIHIHL